MVASGEEASFDHPLLLAATVSPAAAGAAIPSGSVQFQIDGTNSGAPVPLVEGTASLDPGTVTSGPHTIGATYSDGSGAFASSSGSLSVNVSAAAPTLAMVTTSNASPAFGQPVTFTAQIDFTNDRQTAVDGGTVTFTDGSETLGTVPLHNGNASFTTSSLPVGPHLIGAFYSGVGQRIGPSAYTGTVNTAPGGSGQSYSHPGQGTPFNLPSDVALNAAGDLFVADSGNHEIRKITPSGDVTVFAGVGSPGSPRDAYPAYVVGLRDPRGVAVDGSGDVFVADSGNNQIERIDPYGFIFTLTAPNAFNDPEGVAVDSAGNVYVADTGNNVIRKFVPFQGTPTIIAGTGVAGFSGDGGPATAAKLDHPEKIAVDLVGDLFISDTGNDVIREVKPDGTIRTIAGTPGVAGFAGDGGPATAAELDRPTGITVDRAGNLYIADTNNQVIREVSPNGTISTAVGVGGIPGYDGEAIQAPATRLAFPRGVAITPTGTLYYADSENERIREVHPDDLTTVMSSTTTTLTTSVSAPIDYEPVLITATVAATAPGVVPTGMVQFQADGFNLGSPATLVNGQATPGGDDSFAAGHHKITAVYTSDNVALTSSTGTLAGGLDVGPAPTITALVASTETAVYGQPVTFTATIRADPRSGYPASSGSVTFADGSTVLAVVPVTHETVPFTSTHLDPGLHSITATYTPAGSDFLGSSSGTVATFAGGGTRGDKSPATQAALSSPAGVAVDSYGNLFIADAADNRIRLVFPNGGQIVAFVGNGNPGFGGDGGPAKQAQLDDPQAVAVDSAGNLYIADSGNNRIREVLAATRQIVTIAGDGTAGFSGDGGPATLAALNHPTSVSLDSAGDVFIADSGNNRIREFVAATGKIVTVAGSATQGFSGDGGPATLAALDDPTGVAFDGSGHLFIADAGNNRIRELTQATGKISTVAGNGSAGFSGDGGPARAAAFNRPQGVAVDALGNLFVTDSGNNRVREIVQATGVVNTVAGNGTAGFAGDDGPATGAEFQALAGLTLDASGRVFVADAGNNRIRGFTISAPLSISAAPTTTTVTTSDATPPYGEPIRFTATVSAAPSAEAPTGSVQFQVDGTDFGSLVPLVNGQATSAPAGTLDLGAHSVTALYLNADDHFTPSRGSVDHGVTVSPASTCLDILFSDGNPIYGEPVHFTATVSANSPSTATPVGAVQFYADDTKLGDPVPLVNGKATSLPYTVMDLNQLVCSASFISGDPRFLSTDIVFIGPFVKPAPTTTTLTSSSSSTSYGHPVTFTAHVAADPRTTISPDGNTVTFVDGPNIIGTAPVVNGAATFVTTTLALGSNDVSALYQGSRVIAPSNSSGTISTVAGSSSPGDGGPATAAVLPAPYGIAIDGEGNLFFSDNLNSVVRELVKATGQVIRVAGTGVAGFSGDGGPAIDAELNNPTSLAADPAGNLYITDLFNGRVREVVKATGNIVTVPLNWTPPPGATPPGPPTVWPDVDRDAVATDAAGNLYVVVGEDQVIERVASTGDLVLIAGNGSGGFSGDGGPATEAELNRPTALAFDSAGNLYIADTGNARVREVVKATGRIVTVAGDGRSESFGDNVPAISASFADMTALAVDQAGNLYIAESRETAIREVVASTGLVVTVLGSDVQGEFPPNSGGSLTEIRDMTIDSKGNLFFTEPYGYRIRELPSGSTGPVTIAGNDTPAYGGDGGPATNAGLNRPFEIALDGEGNLYIADAANNAVREVIKASGQIITVAGDGTSGFSGDGGPAVSAELFNPNGVAVDSSGNVFIADTGNHRIREVVKATGKIVTVAGGGNFGRPGFAGDGGPAVDAQLFYPTAVVVDPAGNLFISDSLNYRVREVVKATGAIITVAGKGRDGNPGDGNPGDGGPATEAAIGVWLLALDSAGNLFLGASSDGLVREVVKSTGQITTLGTAFSTFDGSDSYVAGVAVDSQGDIFTEWNRQIHEYVGSTGLSLVVAGNGADGFGGDGVPAVASPIHFPTGLAVDASGNVYFAETNSNRIRKVTPGTVVTVSPAPTSTVVASSDPYPVYGEPVTFTASVIADASSSTTPTGSVQFQVDGTDFGAPVPLVNGQAKSAPDGSFGLGTHFVAAIYLNSVDHFAPSQGALARELTVSPAPTNTAVGSSNLNPRYGEPVTFTAAVTVASPSTATPAGSVQFEVDGLDVGNPVPLVNGRATSTPDSALGVGVHQVQAVFVSPAANLAGSTGTLAGGLNVATATTRISLNSPLPSATYGQAVSFTAIVSAAPSAATPSGTVAFYDGSTLLDSEKLDTSGHATSAAVALQAGTHPIVAVFTPSGSSFVGSRSAITDQSIGKAPLTITANSLTKTYGSANPVLTASYSGFVANDSPASLTTRVTLTTAPASSHVGMYPIVPSGATDSNYAITLVSGTLTVTPAALTITASDQSMTYGGKLPTLTATYTGFVNGDSPASLSKPPVLVTSALPASHVGTYAVTVSGADDADYSIHFVSGTLTITPAPLTITANNLATTYGGAIPPLTASYQGLVNGDTPANVQGVLLSTVPASSHAGSYPIAVSGGTDPDYRIRDVGGTLTITPVPLTIVADNKTMVYGGTPPALTASYWGLVNGDTAAVVKGLKLSTAPPNAPVGRYTIAASGAIDPDYRIGELPGTLTITPAPLVIIANDQAMPFGSSPPTLTVRYVGFVNGDTPNNLATPAHVTTTATADSPAGLYPITVVGASSPNYAIINIDGALTVEPYLPPLSPRMIADTAFLNGLYRAVLHRGPDPSGLHYWLGRLSAGEPRLRVIEAFRRSPERSSAPGDLATGTRSLGLPVQVTSAHPAGPLPAVRTT